MTNRILVASDLSEGSDEALRQAHAHCRSTGAVLAICHVLPNRLGMNPLFPRANADSTLRLADLEAKVRDALATQLAACLPGVKAEIYIERGSEYAAIIQRAEAWSADLVVVGSQGRTALPRLHLGSVAERVARHAHGPVLVARSTSSRGVVVVATDLSDPSMPAIIAGAAEARQRSARLVVLHAIEFGSIQITLEEMVDDLTQRGRGWNIDAELRTRAENELKRALARCSAEGEIRVVEGVPAAAVSRVADEVGAELVVIGTRGRTGLARLALGSNAEIILRTAPCSVLAVRLGG